MQLTSFLVDGANGGQREFEIFLASEASHGLREFHERLQVTETKPTATSKIPILCRPGSCSLFQAWLMFFIDAASFIDVDDDSWRFFLLFEKVYICLNLKSFSGSLLFANDLGN